MVHTTGGSESVKKTTEENARKRGFFFLTTHVSAKSPLQLSIKRVVASTGCFAHQSSCFVCRIIMDRRPLMGCGPVRGTP